MASSSIGEARMLSPRTEVEWAGFCSSAHRLQACGWEFAVQRDVFRDRIEVLMANRQLRAAARGWVDAADMRHASMLRNRYLDGNDGVPLIRMQEMRFDEHLMVVRNLTTHHRAEQWHRVDMAPELIHEPELVSVAVLGIFHPWTAEIIVPQSKTIDDLLAEIRGLQKPELAQIRERNRKREWSADQAQQQRVSQIIQIAA